MFFSWWPFIALCKMALALISVGSQWKYDSEYSRVFLLWKLLTLRMHRGYWSWSQEPYTLYVACLSCAVLKHWTTLCTLPGHSVAAKESCKCGITAEVWSKYALCRWSSGFTTCLQQDMYIETSVWEVWQWCDCTEASEQD